MPPSIDRLYPVIALASLAAATVWLERVTRSDDPRPAAEVREHPDFIGKNIHVSHFGDDGQLRYTLVAVTVRHYPLGDVTEFEFPRLRYETEEGLLRAFADRGESHQGGEVLHLQGNAEIYRDGISGNPDISVLSDRLTLWPDDQRAATDDPVVLTQGRTVATGNAMRADNIFGTFELIGDARVTMPPRSSGATQ
jgi:lipopolysaccharide export system protein LptC